MIAGPWRERKRLSVRGHHQGQCWACSLYRCIHCSGIRSGCELGIERTQVAKCRRCCRAIPQSALKNLAGGIRGANGFKRYCVVIREAEIERVRRMQWRQKVHRAPTLAAGQESRGVDLCPRWIGRFSVSLNERNGLGCTTRFNQLLCLMQFARSPRERWLCKKECDQEARNWAEL